MGEFPGCLGFFQHDNEESVASFVSSFCITTHNDVQIHDTTDKAQHSYIPVKTLLPLNFLVWDQALLTVRHH